MLLSYLCPLYIRWFSIFAPNARAFVGCEAKYKVTNFIILLLIIKNKILKKKDFIILLFG